MPAREEQREEPVFVDRGEAPATTGPSHLYSEPRDMTPTGTAAREPFDDSNPNGDNVVVEEKEEESEPKLTIQDIVDRLIIHDDRPIENLPVMAAPELKLIGRCVSFCVTRTVDDVQTVFYYTGLVATVTFTAVTLMHVTRYTRDDFKAYVARERRLTKETGRAEARGETGVAVVAPTMYPTTDAAVATEGLQAHGYTAEGELGVGRDGGLASTQDAASVLRLDAAGSLAPATRLHTFEEDGEAEGEGALSGDPEPETTRAMRRRNFHQSELSFGPLPYATFLRKSIHDVRFGRDPRSTFYALFQDPAKEVEDMQYLRMFVRRYLVHTSEGNNPRQVPLYAFVTVRCACPTMDRELVNRTAREELPGLMRSDKSIAKEKKRQRNRVLRQEQTLRTYQAPEGLFSHTGILYVTRLPQITFFIAMLIFLFVVVFIVYLGVSLGVLHDPLMVEYERQLLRYFIPAIVVWSIAGVSITMHSLYARLPLRTTLVAMVMRLIWSVGAVACSAMVIGVVAMRLKNEKLYTYMSTAKVADLCGFYDDYSCSGFWVPCSGGNLEGPCGRYCAQLAGHQYAQPCYPYVWNRIQLQLIPLIVFAAIVLCLVLYAMFMLWKLWSTVNHITSRLR